MARGKIEKRGQRRRKTKPVILIVTEGSQTEPKYFEHYRNRRTNIDIRVVGSRTSGGETDYLSLIRKAVEYQNKNQISVSEGDSVWVVADGDVNYNNPDPITAKDSLLSKARKMADVKGIHIALSNPCFEFWYLLHFQYTTKFFKDYPAVKNALTTYLPDYEKAGDVYTQLEAYPIIVFTKQLEDRSRKIMEIIEGEDYQDGRLIAHSLYKYEVEDNVTDNRGETHVVGHHKKIGLISDSLKKRLLDNGISNKELEEFMQPPKEVG